MFDEAWRLMRDHYWRPDMGGTDWDGVRSRYRPLVAKIGSHDELIDILWEMHGELGSSHAYAIAPDASPDPARRQGLLGADASIRRWRLAGGAHRARGVNGTTGPVAAAGSGRGHTLRRRDRRRRWPTDRTVCRAGLVVGGHGRQAG